jgi:CspA family cold shock protein
MARGTVKFFNTAKGFGFIKNEETGQDVFVHISGLLEGETIKDNDVVAFETEETPKGTNAIGVHRVAAEGDMAMAA